MYDAVPQFDVSHKTVASRSKMVKGQDSRRIQPFYSANKKTLVSKSNLNESGAFACWDMLTF